MCVSIIMLIDPWWLCWWRSLFCMFETPSSCPANYPVGHPLHCKRNSKNLFFFKNECATSRPLLYCALKAKSYAILTEESLADLKNKIKKLETEEGSEGRLYTKLANSHVKNKGVVRSMVSELGIVQYLVALLSNTTISSSFKKLQLYSGIMHLMSMTKVSLSALDDKTQTLDCGICVRPFGHYNTDLKCGNCI